MHELLLQEKEVISFPTEINFNHISIVMLRAWENTLANLQSATSSKEKALMELSELLGTKKSPLSEMETRSMVRKVRSAWQEKAGKGIRLSTLSREDKEHVLKNLYPTKIDKVVNIVDDILSNQRVIASEKNTARKLRLWENYIKNQPQRDLEIKQRLISNQNEPLQTKEKRMLTEFKDLAPKAVIQKFLNPEAYRPRRLNKEILDALDTNLFTPLAPLADTSKPHQENTFHIIATEKSLPSNISEALRIDPQEWVNLLWQKKVVSREINVDKVAQKLDPEQTEVRAMEARAIAKGLNPTLNGMNTIENLSRDWAKKRVDQLWQMIKDRRVRLEAIKNMGLGFSPGS